MKNIDDIIRAMDRCTSDGASCLNCPYQGCFDCTSDMMKDALEVLKKYRKLVDFIQQQCGQTKEAV